MIKKKNIYWHKCNSINHIYKHLWFGWHTICAKINNYINFENRNVFEFNYFCNQLQIFFFFYLFVRIVFPSNYGENIQKLKLKKLIFFIALLKSKANNMFIYVAYMYDVDCDCCAKSIPFNHNSYHLYLTDNIWTKRQKS